MADLFFMPCAEAQNASGGVLAGAKLEFFSTGTSTPLDTFTSNDRDTANANPVVADSAGRWTPIFLKDETYKVVLSDSDDVQIWSHDPYTSGTGQFVDQTINSVINTTGSSNAFAATVLTTFDALTNGMEFTLKANFTVTGATTLAITPAGGSALSAATIHKHHDQDLEQGDIEDGQWFTVKFDGSEFQLQTPLASAPLFLKNLLINGDMRCDQRRGDGTAYTATTTPVNSDDTFLLDRWLLQSDGADVVDVSQETSVVPVGSYAAIKLDVETADKKFGILQILEGKDAEAIIGNVCSLSFKARRTGTSIANLRAAVIAWDSTVDAVTSDIIADAAWGAVNVDPTLATNWTYENTPASLDVLTTSYQTFAITNISIDTASTKNVAVFIWIDDVTTTVGDVIYITDVQLELGSGASSFQRRLHAEEVALCQRYYEKSYNQAVIPATSTEAGAVRLTDPVAAGSVSIQYRVTKRAAPTMAGYSTTGAITKYRDLTSGADFDITLEDIGDSGCHASLATSGAIDEFKGFHWTAEAEL